jgi:hypothetical protein
MARQRKRRKMYEDLKLQAGGTNTSKVGRKTHKLLFETLEASQKLHVLRGSDKYFIVDEIWEVNLSSLDEAFCGCRRYIDTGLPCIHMAAAFLHPRTPGRSDLPEDLSEYADPHYRLETLAKVYKEVVILCMAGRDLLPDGITLPQADVPQAGRPKKKRRRGGSDKQLDQKKKAVSRCSRCRKVLLGHNSRSCKEELELEQDGLVECEVEDDYKNNEVTMNTDTPVSGFGTDVQDRFALFYVDDGAVGSTDLPLMSWQTASGGLGSVQTPRRQR